MTKDNGEDKDYQLWNVVYVDESPEVKDKGYSEKWGFHINKPFHIIS
jgi:hypothetical protein